MFNGLNINSNYIKGKKQMDEFVDVINEYGIKTGEIFIDIKEYKSLFNNGYMVEGAKYCYKVLEYMK